MKELISQIDTTRFTSKEIAQMLGKKVNIVRSYLHKYDVPYKKKFDRSLVDTGLSGGDIFKWEIFFDDIMFLS